MENNRIINEKENISLLTERDFNEINGLISKLDAPLNAIETDINDYSNAETRHTVIDTARRIKAIAQRYIETGSLRNQTLNLAVATIRIRELVENLLKSAESDAVNDLIGHNAYDVKDIQYEIELILLDADLWII